MTQRLKIAAIVFLILSVIGFIDSAYLTAKHYSGVIPPCTIKGCEVVLASKYSEVAGLPVALFGSLYYLVILSLSASYLVVKKEPIIKFEAILTPLGLIASMYFVYLQLFVIKAICQYCMLSAGISTLIFVVGMYVLLELNKNKKLV